MIHCCWFSSLALTACCKNRASEARRSARARTSASWVVAAIGCAAHCETRVPSASQPSTSQTLATSASCTWAWGWWWSQVPPSNAFCSASRSPSTSSRNCAMTCRRAPSSTSCPWGADDPSVPNAASACSSRPANSTSFRAFSTVLARAWMSSKSVDKSLRASSTSVERSRATPVTRRCAAAGSPLSKWAFSSVNSVRTRFSTCRSASPPCPEPIGAGTSNWSRCAMAAACGSLAAASAR